MDVPYGKTCQIYTAHLDTRGSYSNSGEPHTVQCKEDAKVLWEKIVHEKRPNNMQTRVLFVDNMMGPVLQILGPLSTTFFSSSLSQVPKRVQEEIRPGKGDHITVSLTFLRVMNGPNPGPVNVNGGSAWDEEKIDTQAPLFLNSNLGSSLVLNHLFVHLIRNVAGNTIISCHRSGPDATPAQYLHERIQFAAQSVYWHNLFQKSPDSTIVLLLFIWHAIYSWDEVLDTLSDHICWLERQAQKASNKGISRDLHNTCAHHLHYRSLLKDLRQTVLFIRDTPNPAMDSEPEELKLRGKRLLERECDIILIEIDRLDTASNLQDERLEDVMNQFRFVARMQALNLHDGRLDNVMNRFQALARDIAKNIAAIKQAPFILFGVFTAAAFGLNVHVQFLPRHFVTGLLVVVITIWLLLTRLQITFMKPVASLRLWFHELFRNKRNGRPSA
ncbi:hypothetical protein PM082_020107 [Marasmius tenuissimus]|nr:hypothetical protein PM082_020107 [Marasmius tenuissimus]